MVLPAEIFIEEKRIDGKEGQEEMKKADRVRWIVE